MSISETKKSTAWLLLVSSVSGENKTARMRIWRALKASGAGALRDGVYVLPNSAAAEAVFQQQAGEVIAAGGSAHIMSLDSRNATQQREFASLFNRNAEYAELFHQLDRIKTGIVKLDEAQARRQIAALRRDVDALVVVDFFPGPPRHQVERALIDAEAALNAHFSPDEPHALKGGIPRCDRARYRGRTWATRERLWIDRVASAWLIRRFIDPKAELKFVPAKGYVPEPGELRFDMFDAEFTHVGDRCTFEVLVERMGLYDPALVAIGEIIHDLDLRDDKFGRDEVAGVRSAIDGICTVARDDDQRIVAATPMLDGLHSHFALRARKSTR